jgi:hypothetical protein
LPVVASMLVRIGVVVPKATKSTTPSSLSIRFNTLMRSTVICARTILIGTSSP